MVDVVQGVTRRKTVQGMTDAAKGCCETLVVGKEGPGPIYDLKSSFGRQDSSRMAGAYTRSHSSST